MSLLTSAHVQPLQHVPIQDGVPGRAPTAPGTSPCPWAARSRWHRRPLLAPPQLVLQQRPPHCEAVNASHVGFGSRHSTVQLDRSVKAQGAADSIKSNHIGFQRSGLYLPLGGHCRRAHLDSFDAVAQCPSLLLQPNASYYPTQESDDSITEHECHPQQDDPSALTLPQGQKQTCRACFSWLERHLTS